MIQTEVVATNEYMPEGTKFVIRTHFHDRLRVFVTDFYMYDGGWNDGYNPMEHDDFDCRIFHEGTTSSSELEKLHQSACNEVTSGEYCSGRYLFP